MMIIKKSKTIRYDLISPNILLVIAQLNKYPTHAKPINRNTIITL
jgi:hypothetical protein